MEIDWRCTMRTSRGGLTLIEVLVAATVLGIISTMIGHAVVVAFRAQRTGEAKVNNIRQGALALDWMQRELSTSSSLFNPNPNASVNGWSPTQADPLRFARNSATGPSEVWYWHDATNQEVRRWETGDPPEGRVVARNVDTLTVTHLAFSPVIQANLQVTTMTKPITSTARVLSL